VLFTVLLGAYALAALYKFFSISRPELAIGRPLAVAYTVRVGAVLLLSLSGAAGGLRGGDEPGFVAHGQRIAGTPFGSDVWTDAISSELFKAVFASQFALFDAPQIAIRMTQVTIATAGLLLMIVAVYDLAGPRAALLAGWVLAFEPTSVFFAGIIHKEPLMLLAEGLVAYGGAQLWASGALIGVLPMATGCLVGIATRRYAGLFLVSAAVFIVLHAAFRVRRESGIRSLGLLFAVAIALSVSLPTMIYATSESELDKLQTSQDANASDEKANLSLERVDYSSRSAVLENLPVRLGDVLTKPYPWQLQNASQRLGLLGTLFFWTVLVLFIQAAYRLRGSVMDRAGPLLYPALAVLVAYSLSAGNAGTAFRYRTHVVVMVICIMVVLRTHFEARVRAAPGTHGRATDRRRDPIIAAA